MVTKLTLSIEEEVIKKAKLVSSRRGKSISKMVEDFLGSLIEKEEPETAVDRMNRLMETWREKINLPANTNYKEMIRQWRYEDYMKESESRMKASRKKIK
jgi:hypothetical protein